LTQIGQEAIHRDGHTEKTKFVYGVVRIIFVENDSRALQLAAFISVFFAKRNTYVALGSIFFFLIQGIILDFKVSFNGRQRAFVGSPALRNGNHSMFFSNKRGNWGRKAAKRHFYLWNFVLGTTGSTGTQVISQGRSVFCLFFST
jgi:hypothetical protein